MRNPHLRDLAYKATWHLLHMHATEAPITLQTWGCKALAQYGDRTADGALLARLELAAA